MVSLLACLAALIAAGSAAASGSAASGPRNPVRTCESLRSLSLPDTTIDSAAEHPADAAAPASCRVHLSVTHPPAGDDVNVDIWMPVSGWNGRFQGTGGGGESGGSPDNLPEPLRAGYAAGSTDAGHPGNSGSFALNPDGSLNWQRIRDFGYQGIHDMTVAGKALVRAYYGAGPRYSYFNGCSTGGRQGIMEAQRYPSDYDGIVAGSPAINYTDFHSAQLWGELVMLESDDFVPACKLEAARVAAIEACDSLDGVRDGVIGDPRACRFDPGRLVGRSTPCGTITAADAMVIRKIWQGPRYRDGRFMWYGLPRGATFTDPGVSETAVGPDGELTGAPFFATLTWFTYWVAQDPEFDWRTLTRAEFDRLHRSEKAQLSGVIASNDPDLRAFRDAGGKLLMWHGYADWGIFPQGTIDYYERVARLIGGSVHRTQKFARLFMAPGVGHCGGGAGPAPTGELDAVVKWVEQGRAPHTLEAVKRDSDGDITQTRPLCPYPDVARYDGRGDPDVAVSFDCRRSYGHGHGHGGHGHGGHGHRHGGHGG